MKQQEDAPSSQLRSTDFLRQNQLVAPHHLNYFSEEQMAQIHVHTSRSLREDVEPPVALWTGARPDFTVFGQGND
jgi:hypothetical protein